MLNLLMAFETSLELACCTSVRLLGVEVCPAVYAGSVNRGLVQGSITLAYENKSDGVPGRGLCFQAHKSWLSLPRFAVLGRWRIKDIVPGGDSFSQVCHDAA